MKPNARIPTRPLSYNEVGLAYRRELIIDYDKGILYMKDDNGNIRCITTSIVTQVINEIMMNPDDFDFAHYITIIYNGDRFPLDEFSTLMREMLERLKSLLGWKVEVTVNPDTGEIDDSKTVLQVIDNILAEIQKLKEKDNNLQEQINNLKTTKTETYETSVSVTTAGWTTLIANKHYSKTIAVPNIKSTDRAKVYPIYSEDYNTMINQMGAVGNICRVISNDGNITIYSMGLPKVNFTLGLEIPRVIHKGIPASS